MSRQSNNILLYEDDSALAGEIVANRVVTRAMLREDVWNYSVATQTNVVDVHVGNLRRKVDADGEDKLVTSVRGLGFRLDV